MTSAAAISPHAILSKTKCIFLSIYVDYQYEASISNCYNVVEQE